MSDCKSIEGNEVRQRRDHARQVCSIYRPNPRTCAENMCSHRFFKMLGTDEMRAWYGPDHVALAADRGAIGTLLISDELFR